MDSGRISSDSDDASPGADPGLSAIAWSWLPWAMLGVSIVLSVLVLAFQLRGSEEAARQRFAFRVKETTQAIKERLSRYEMMLRAGANFLATSPLADRTDWQSFVAGLKIQAEYPGIQGVGFSRYVPGPELKAHVSAIRAEGFADYAVRPAGVRADYAVVVWLEPFDWRNQRAFGYDMLSEPTRRAAMERARDSGEPALSGKVKLMQETDDAPQAGFLMYVPLYRYREQARTVEERRIALAGYVYAPFRMNDLMRGILGTRESDIDLEISDGREPAGEHLMFDLDQSSSLTAAGDPARATALFRDTTDMEINGHHWQLRVASTPAFEATVDRTTAWIEAVACVAFGLLLFQALRATLQTRATALRLAARMTAELADREARLQALFESIRDAIIVADVEGNIEHCNPATAQMFGLPGEALIGRNVTALMPGSHRSGHDNYLSLAAASGKMHRITGTREFQALRSDGTEFPVELSLSQTGRGGERRFIAVLRDITERRRIDEELREHRDSLQVMVFERTADLIAAKVAAESASRAKTEFLANMSHELRTPMHAILSFASLGLKASSRSENSPAARYFGNIDTAGQRLMRLLNDLLDLARIEAQGVTIQTLPQPFAPLLAEVVEEMEPLARQHGHILSTGPGGSQALVSMDALRVGQVLRNLLNNAFRFSPPGGVIEIEYGESPPGWLQVSVHDQGIGIPSTEIELIFDKFVQSSRTRTGAGGTGLGLAICREIVTGHGGRIWAENNPAGDTCFRFTLPLAIAPASGEIEPELCAAG